MLKRSFYLFVIFSFLLSVGFGENEGWAKEKNVYYKIFRSMSKGKILDIPYVFDSNKKFSAIAIGKGNGNFDIDIGLFDEKGVLVSMDTDPDFIGVVTHQFDKDQTKARLKISCNSGRGLVVVYVGESQKLLKRMTLNYINK